MSDSLSLPAVELPPASILLVENEPRRRRNCRRTLEQLGYEVEAVADAAVAWEAMRKKPFDLIVTDNGMPRMNGVDFARRLRREGVTLPIIMATCCVASLLDQDLSSIGFAAVLVKPFSTADLQSAVERALPPGPPGRRVPCQPCAGNVAQFTRR